MQYQQYFIHTHIYIYIMAASYLTMFLGVVMNANLLFALSTSLVEIEVEDIFCHREHDRLGDSLVV